MEAAQPGGGPPTMERRSGEDRRDDIRALSPGRRAEDKKQARWYNLQAAFWAVIGAIVVLYLFFVALGGVDPDEAPAATIVIAVLALMWLAHAWRRIWAGGYSSSADRERRGF